MKTGFAASLAALAFLLAGCGEMVPAQVITMSDSAKAFRITCGGLFSSNKDCYDRASSICHGGPFSILQETDISPPSTSYFWSTGAHEIVMRCNNNTF
jgi:hypothetical protein